VIGDVVHVGQVRGEGAPGRFTGGDGDRSRGVAAGIPGIDSYARATALGAIQASGGNASAAVAVAAGETTGRTFAAHLSDVYNIADHGALGDAVSDTIAMSKAVAYAAANPGTHILIPDGSWAFTVSTSYGFQIPSFTTVEGEDQAATILTWNDTAGDDPFTAASNTSSTRTADITFQEFTVKGSWGTATGSVAAYAIGNAPFIPANTDGLTFFHITSEYSRGFGISARGSTAVTVHDSHTRYTLSDAINLSQCSDVSVDNNHIEHTDDDSISVHSDIYDTLGVRRNIDITGNHIFDAQGIDVLAARQANISNNTLDTVRQTVISVTTIAPGTTYRQPASSRRTSVSSRPTASALSFRQGTVANCSPPACRNTSRSSLPISSSVSMQSARKPGVSTTTRRMPAAAHFLIFGSV
jgi:hypothetical protein